MSDPRFEVRAMAGGWAIWDRKLGARHGQLPYSHWWPSTARHRAQAWVDRQTPIAVPAS